MQPTTAYDLAKSQIAELHQQAKRQTRVRAARQVRRRRDRQGSYPASWLRVVLADRLPTLLGSRNT